MKIFDIPFDFNVTLHQTSFPGYTRAGLQVLELLFGRVIFQNEESVEA